MIGLRKRAVVDHDNARMRQAFAFVIVVAGMILPAKAHAAGICPRTGAYHWPNGTAGSPVTVYYTVDPQTITSSRQIFQIGDAIQLWNETLAANNVYVKFVAAPAGTSPYLVIKNDATTACLPTGEASGNRTLTANSTTIVFRPFTTECGWKAIDPDKNGYNSIFFKLTLHEIGHTLGLLNVIDDASGVPNLANCSQESRGSSVMNTPACYRNNTNDVENNVPIAPATCDTDQVKVVYPPPTTGGGCGLDGCGGCNQGIHVNPDVGGDESPQLCNGCNCSPVVIDVNGDGFSFTNADDGVAFDITATGRLQAVSWTSVGADDAFLVLDRNGNGLIDDGSEVFGDSTPQPESTHPNGFAALAVFDREEEGGNEDGEISREDAVYSRLQLWQDRNHNGISESEELYSLPELGVRAIELDYKESRRVDEFGNEFKYRAKVRRVHGASDGRWAYDVFLQAR